MTFVEVYINQDQTPRTKSAAESKDIISILEGDRFLLDQTRQPLEYFLDPTLITVSEREIQEAKILESAGLTKHPVALKDRLALMQNERRALIIGITEESMVAARGLLQKGVGVVLLDTFPGQQSGSDFAVNNRDIFHHPLMITMDTHEKTDFTKASQVFHGILINEQSRTLGSIAGIAEKNAHIIYGSGLSADVMIGASGRITKNKKTVASVALQHDGSLQKMVVTGDDPHAIVESAMHAVSLSIAHEKARLAKRNQGLSQSIDSARTAIQQVEEEQLPQSALHKVVIYHKEGMAPFEAIGLTREKLAGRGIAVFDGKQIQAVREAPLTDGLHVDSVWAATTSMSFLKTEGIGALIVADVAPIREQADGTPVIMSLGEYISGAINLSGPKSDMARLFSVLIAPKPDLTDYQAETIAALQKEGIVPEKFSPAEFIKERQEHLLEASGEAISDLLRSYAETVIARIGRKKSYSKREKTQLRQAQFMIRVSYSFTQDEYRVAVPVNNIGIPDMMIRSQRYSNMIGAIPSHVALGVQVLHDGSIQIQGADGTWSPIENMRQIKSADGETMLSVIDHARNGKVPAEARLLRHIMGRLGMHHLRLDPNIKYTSSIFGLRGARTKQLMESFASKSNGGRKGSLYHTPGGGMRILYGHDASTRDHSIQINAQGIVTHVADAIVSVNRHNQDMNFRKLERMLPFPLKAKDSAEANMLHERAVRHFFHLSLCALLSPYHMDFLQNAGRADGDIFNIAHHFTLEKRMVGTVEDRIETESYYAVQYNTEMFTGYDIGLAISESGRMSRFDATLGENGQWKEVGSDSELLDHILAQLNMPLSHSQNVPFHALQFLSEGVAAADEVLSHPQSVAPIVFDEHASVLD